MHSQINSREADTTDDHDRDHPHRDSVRTVADSIDECGIDAGSVCLEICERVVVSDIESTQRTLASLKEVGVQIAIDDFGTGYAVLAHLESLRVDTLKIDTNIVRNLGTNAGNLATLRANHWTC